jgi:formylglycine-generating enzyme required for sulfatase activity
MNGRFVALKVSLEMARWCERMLFCASLSALAACQANDTPISWQDFPSDDSFSDATDATLGTEVGDTGIGHNDTSSGTSTLSLNSTTSSNPSTLDETSSSVDTGTCMGPCGSAGCGTCPETLNVSVGSFAIDATEVTYRAYSAFIDAGYSLVNQSPECTWNEAFIPKASWPPNQGQLDFPVVYVNWCQAQAFCTWRGAHLCGQIGGGANDFSSYKTATKSQWYHACTGGGVSEYPYGNGTYDPTACNGKEYGVRKSLPVPAVATCEGHFDGVYDLSGNVYEWTNECERGDLQSNNCRRRGGSYFSDNEFLRCANGSARARDHVDDYTGFRCCVEIP